MKSSLMLTLFVLQVLLSATTTFAADWPSWRGPAGDGICTSASDLPAEFGPEQNVAWRVPLDGPAGSTPIIVGEKIFLTTVKGADVLLLCLNKKDGKELWRRTVGTGNYTSQGDEGNCCAPSPTSDGERVYCFFGTGDLACFDLEGKKIWQRNLAKDYGKFKMLFVFSSSPVLHGDNLYQQMLHNGGQTVVAINKMTGKEVWKITRKTNAIKECLDSYASPKIYQDKDRTLLLTHGADYLIGHSLKDGSEIFRLGGLHPESGYNPTLRFVASPLAIPGLIVVPTAKKSYSFGILPDGQGNITGTDKVLWKYKITPDVVTPLYAGGCVYLIADKAGVLHCIDAKTGDAHYVEPLHRHKHRASPLLADGKIYIPARDGVVNVIKVGKKFEVLAKNKMGERIASSPIADGKRLYLRTYEALYALGK